MDSSTDMPACDHTLGQRWGPGGATGKAPRHICDLHYVFNNCGFITSHFFRYQPWAKFYFNCYALHWERSGEDLKNRQEAHIFLQLLVD